jgi:hypothetical protein
VTLTLKDESRIIAVNWLTGAVVIQDPARP